MEVKNHIYYEENEEEKIIFFNGSCVYKKTFSNFGESKFRNIDDGYHYSSESNLDKKKLNTTNYDELNKHCSILSNRIKSLSKYINYIQINVTSLIKNKKIIYNEDEIIESKRFHGRFFFEICLRKEEKIFKTVYDQGFTTLNDLVKEDWWKIISEEKILRKFSRLECFLNRMKLSKGVYNLILSPYVSGLLVHEVFGHIFEYDNYSNNLTLLEELSKKTYHKNLTIIDNPRINNGWGSLEYDDVGKKQEKMIILNNGDFSEEVKSGDRISRLIRENYKKKNLFRVSNTLLLSGDKSEEELFCRSNGGIYIENAGQCYCDPITGQIIIPVYEAFKINDYEKKNALEEFTIRLSVKEILNSIKEIGNNFELNGIICGKVGQKIPVGIGSPSILLENIYID